MARNGTGAGAHWAVLSDLCALSGAGLMSYGAWLVYRPAGFIVGGVLLLLAGVVGALRRGR